jgi:hypothetical protein
MYLFTVERATPESRMPLQHSSNSLWRNERRMFSFQMVLSGFAVLAHVETGTMQGDVS